MKSKNVIKFVLLSLMGIFLFFVPVSQSAVPVAIFVDLVKRAAGPRLPDLAVLSTFLLLATLTLGKLFRIEPLRAYHEDDSPVKCVIYVLSAVIVLMKLMDVNLPFIQNPEIGGKVLPLAATIFLTIALAGWLVIFIIKSGIVEFVAILVEPVMRPVFKLPGEAAVNMISSFVSSASVGVYFSEQYYKKKVYTAKEVCAVVTNFSVISVGYIGVLASLANISDMYGTLLITSFVLVLLMAVVMIRIPPLSRIPDTYIDNTVAVAAAAENMTLKQRFGAAVGEGVAVSREFTRAAFINSFFQALKFAQKIIAVMIPTVVFVLALVYYTPVFEWLAYPVTPILKLAGVPEAAMAAPSVLIGIVEVSLPSILISGREVSRQCAFFVVQLSIVQIIFFSEAGNAILSSKVPLGVLKLIGIFLIRTLVAIPLVALLSHILF